MPGLGASFGRGAATNTMQDLANSDCVLFMGSNMAEAHPVGFRWPMKAKDKGATLMHVDPRFSRTSALCDVFVGIRAGTDIAFLGGLIHYVLKNNRWFHEYVMAYTNATVIIEEDFGDSDDFTGVFSGFDPETHSYDADKGHWVRTKTQARTTEGAPVASKRSRKAVSTAPTATVRWGAESPEGRPCMTRACSTRAA